MKIRNLLTILLFYLFVNVIVAQDFSGRWTDHFSYLQIKAITESTTTIYGAAENAVFSYDIASGEIEKLSTVNGLSGQKISALYYSENFKALIIGYENGIIDIVFEDNDDVFTAVDIFRKTTLTDTERRINHFIENDDNELYISADFGIIVFDLNRLEFGDTFFIGSENSKIAIAQTTFFEGKIFAASKTSGILTADQNGANLIDSNVWNTLQSGNFSGIQTFGNSVYAATDGTMLLKYNGTTFDTEIDYATKINAFHSNDTHLTVALVNNIFSYNTSFEQVSSITRESSETPTPFTTATTFNNIVYLGSQDSGMFSYTFNSNTAQQQINPDGPALNIPRAVAVFEGNLWLTYGQYQFFYAPIGDSRGISFFNKTSDSWRNFTRTEIFEATPITDIAINPANPSQVFFGGYQNGLLEFRDNKPFKLYDAVNTNPGGQIDPDKRLETIPNTDNLVRVHALFFNNEELLFTNSLVPGTAIKKYDTTSDSFSSINFSNILNRVSMRFSEMLITETNTLFLGSYLDGVIAHDIGTDRFRKITNGLDDTADIRTIALDKNDQLWVGATNGLRILSNASGVFQEQNPVLSDIVVSENGINQQILNGEFIWDIVVDGSNNKWIATQDSGVFYLSADGEEALEHFTTTNSPLPSNFVQSIAIDDSTGAVYFATQGGLIQFQGLATGSNKNLDKLRAFPNPVRPGFNKFVTIDGLIEGANVKVTDIEGNLVFETVSQGGSVQWDTRAFGKHKVASGVYLVLVTGEELIETKVAKLMIVR